MKQKDLFLHFFWRLFRKLMPLFRHRLVIFFNCDDFLLFSPHLSSGLWRHSIIVEKEDGSDVNETKCCFFPSHQRLFKVIVGSLCMWSWGREGAKLQAPHTPLQSDPIIWQYSKAASITTFSETLCLPPFHLSPFLSSFFFPYSLLKKSHFFLSLGWCWQSQNEASSLCLWCTASVPSLT